MNNNTLTLELCPDCFEEFEEAAAYFGYDAVGDFVADMIVTEFPRAKMQMLANKYLEYEEAMERMAGLPPKKPPSPLN